MQGQTITLHSTEEIPFVLVDSKTKLGKDVAVETIKIVVSKSGGALQPVANPVISGRGVGLYYWKVAPTHTDTLGSLVYFCSAAGCEDWRDFIDVVA
jgi:hypothetical protein